MSNSYLLLSAVFIPLTGAFILPLIGKASERVRNVVALALVVLSLGASSCLAPSALHGTITTFTHHLPIGFDFVLTADPLAVFMAIASSLVGAVIILFSFGYISHYQNRNEYYLMVVLFLGSMMGLVYSANLIFIYIFWEITAIASWRLIGFFREKTHVLRADKAFLVTAFGALVMLIGFILIYFETGSFNLSVIKQSLSGGHVSNLIALLILFGILTKSATLPFHTWLPDAGVAPSPVTALLHAAVLVKIGVYVFARLFIATFSLSPSWSIALAILAGASALISAGAAFVETDMKRIIAYSTISQIAFIFLGLAIGGPIGVAGALLYILMHGLAKGGLFLCAGIIEQSTKTKDIRKMGGLITTMPVTAVAFLLCAFSVMGVPPLGGFFSKYMVFSGAVNSGHIFITATFLIGAVMTILYLIRLFNAIFMGTVQGTPAREGSRLMVASVVILAGLSVLFGLYIYYPSQFVQTTVKSMFGI